MSIKFDELTKGLTLVGENNIVVKLIKKGRSAWLTDHPQYQFIRPSDIDGWQLSETENQPNPNGSIDPTELEKNQTILYINQEWQLEDIDYTFDGSARLKLKLRRGSKSVWVAAVDCQLPMAKITKPTTPKPQKPKQPLLKLTPPGQPAKPKMDNLPVTPTYIYITDNKTLDLHLDRTYATTLYVAH